MSDNKVVGKATPRITAFLEASGTAQYAPDIKLSGMLHAKILRSPFPHAVIKKIDVSKATKLLGVVAVITYKDVPRIAYTGEGGPPSISFTGEAERPTEAFPKDEYILDKRVRHVGDKVAAVAAVDEDTAEEALELINVEYKELPAVFDPEEAMKPGAPKIHQSEKNIAVHILNEWGDIEKGFREADYVFEGSYKTPRQVHAPMEPHGAIADYNQYSGELTVWTTTQIPFVNQRILSELLGIPMNKIRIIKTFTGGGFGGKDEILLEPICAVLSMKTGRPVRLILTREEVFIGSRTRHPATIYVKTGVKKDGTITARHVRAILNGGAYASHGPSVTAAMGSREIGLYKSPNVKFDGYCVYTNCPVAGAFRGYGNPQQTFGIEQQMDEISEKLVMDPVELRLKNTIRKGDLNPGTGMKLGSCGLQECMTKGAKKMGWMKKRKMPKYSGASKRRGYGMGIFMHNSGCVPYLPECSSSIVTVNSDGTARVLIGSTDIGQGSSTIMAQIAAEELGISLKDVSVTSADTGIVPFDQGTYGSRTTYIMGNAVMLAARDAKNQILELASKVLGRKAENLEINEGKVRVKKGNKREIPISKIIVGFQFAPKEGKIVVGKASFQPLGNAPYFGAQFMEVEVDTETGQVKVLRVVNAQDVGKAINPTAVEGQMNGTVYMGMGLALTEDQVVDEKGRSLNPNFTEYKLLSASDMPKIDLIIVEDKEPSGPFGAKGVGEGGLDPTAAALANAVYDALGVRVKQMPLLSETVYKYIVGKK